ncbi:hypothetical protein AAG906_004716 [Vitis piasezkii]
MEELAVVNDTRFHSMEDRIDEYRPLHLSFEHLDRDLGVLRSMVLSVNYVKIIVCDCSMEYYLQKTYYKTASLISNSCKASALLAGQTAEVSMLAFEYAKNLVLTWCNCYDLLWRRYWCCLLWFSFLCLFQSDWSGAALFSGHGLAFQLIDDVLDFTGTSASLGKGSLSDIRHCNPSFFDGIITAPILFAIEEFPQLDAVVKRGLDNPADIDLVSF